MRVSVCVLSSLMFVASSEAFRPLNIPPATTRISAQSKINEFDYLLGESGKLQNHQQHAVSRRRIHLSDDRSTVLVSTTFAETVTEGDSMLEEEVDPFADIGLEQASPQLQKVQQDQSFSQRMESKLKTMDLSDVVSTLVIPSIAVFAGGRWVYNRAANRVGKSFDDLLDSFATEMVYHDGDFEEMKLCQSDYNKKLVVLGPRKTQAMLKRYLQLYAKKKTVSPQSISSLSYVFSLFKLSEEKTAQILVSLCKDMGDAKISSAGKLLFFGSRILKSAEGKAALEPIRDMIKGTYREATVAETMVETSQQAMAEAAYKTTVLAAGKGQKSLTAGWQVLGLDKETATRIYEEEASAGFLSEREKMYGGQSTKYDSKGRAIDKEGNYVDEADKKEAEKDEDKEAEPTSNVYECSECGFTLFIAKGREFKFYGDDFKCPECGADKDKFKARDMNSE